MAIRFRVEGDLRFISHHDTMRLFERALSRAQLPVKFSEGFNPRARMSLPLPRPVGVATSADVLVIELCDPMNASEVLARLQKQMPQGLTLNEAFEVQQGEKLHPELVHYEVPVPEACAENVRQALAQITSADQWLIERTDDRGRPLRTIDLKLLLVEAKAEPGWLRWNCRVPDNGSAKPGEWLKAFGLNPADSLHLMHRTAVQWRTGPLTGDEPEPAETAGATDPP